MKTIIGLKKDDQRRGPEEDDETDGSTDRVNVASLQRPTDGVVPAAIDREFEFYDFFFIFKN